MSASIDKSKDKLLQYLGSTPPGGTAPNTVQDRLGREIGRMIRHELRDVLRSAIKDETKHTEHAALYVLRQEIERVVEVFDEYDDHVILARDLTAIQL